MIHICQEQKWCDCRQDADEPNESCFIHGAGKYPPRCEICGRFMQRKEKKR